MSKNLKKIVEKIVIFSLKSTSLKALARCKAQLDKKGFGTATEAVSLHTKLGCGTVYILWLWYRVLTLSRSHFLPIFTAQILTFKVEFDIEGQGQSAHKTTGPLGPNWVFLAWVGVELSRGQAKVLTRPDGHTHGQMQATTIP